MAYQNNQNQGGDTGYDKNKDILIHKKSVKSEKKYLNCEVYSYDNKPAKIRIRPCVQNTNPDQTDPNKKWINLKGISGITKQEALDLSAALKECAEQI